MTRIAVLTPDPADMSYAGQWPGVLERLSNALALVEITVEPLAWTEHAETAERLAAFPLALPLLAWGYHRDHARWLSATRLWETSGIPMLNPPSVLGLNSDKAYLGRLSRAGVAIPPTLWVDAPTDEDVQQAFETLGTDILVIKPRVSGGAWRTLKLQRGDRMTEGPRGPAIIQTYLPSIETDGETSLLYFGGRLSHAVRKTPEPGDFRIQSQLGGVYEATSPAPGAVTLAEQTLKALDRDLLYARIDLAQDAGGRWRLMEAELIEPDFYLSQAPDAGRMFAEAVERRLAGRAG